MIKIYTDTNVLRYFGLAFSEMSLADELQEQLLVPPLALMELLSQLGTSQAKEAFAAIQAFPRVFSSKATGVLPWTQDIFRAYLFNLPMSDNTITPVLNTAVNNVLNASRPEDLSEGGAEVRAMLDEVKKKEPRILSMLWPLGAWREVCLTSKT